MALSLFLSHPLNDRTPAYGGTMPVRIMRDKSINAGDSSNTQKWEMPNHIGTHVDAPLHFINEGRGIVSYPPEFWICRRVVLAHIPLDTPRWITESDITMPLPRDVECLLIRTGFQRWRGMPQYTDDNPGLSPELAVWLRGRFPELRFIGMDFISLSRFTDRERGRVAHREFLRPGPSGSPILPIEDMDLAGLSSTSAIRRLSLFPVRVDGADGAPVTVVAELE